MTKIWFEAIEGRETRERMEEVIEARRQQGWQLLSLQIGPRNRIEAWFTREDNQNSNGLTMHAVTAASTQKHLSDIDAFVTRADHTKAIAVEFAEMVEKLLDYNIMDRVLGGKDRGLLRDSIAAIRERAREQGKFHTIADIALARLAELTKEDK